jgi:hypothetical protein
MKEGYEDIKRAIGTFIEAQVASLSGKVFATFPESATAVPCVVIDIITSKSEPLLEGGVQEGLARLTIVDTKTRTLDQLFDDVYIAFVKNGYTIDDFSYGGVFMTSPVMPAFLEKDEIYKREMDLNISWIIVR